MARKCALVIQNQNETFNGQTEQSDSSCIYLSGISGRGVKQKVLLGPAWMGKHMCILPLSYISEAANLLWQPEGSPRRIVSPVISSTTQPALLLALPPRPWPPCCDTLPPLDAHHMLCSQAGCRRSYVLADDKALCRLLLPTCRPWKPTPDRCIGGEEGAPGSRQAGQASTPTSYQATQPS